MANGEASPAPEAEIDVNAMRDPAIQLYGLTGVDAAYTFYYDETNNIRRLSVSANGLNVLNPQVFVLGGIVQTGGERSLDFPGLRAALRLQPTLKELKFQHVAHGDFPTVLSSKKLTAFLDWLESQDLDLHYFALDPLFWATIDIIDSIVADKAARLALIAPQLKNDLHRILLSDLTATLELFHRYAYPDIAPSRRKSFVRELLQLLEHGTAELEPFNRQLLKGVLQMGLRATALPFIEGGTPRVLVEEFSTFFLHRICLFKSSRHILDEEDVVKAAIGNRCFMDGRRRLDPYRFARSHDEPGIQISDVVVGLLGKCFTWLNSIDLPSVERSLAEFHAHQKSNRTRLNALLDRSLAQCPAFFQQVLSLDCQQRGAVFLEA